MKPFFTAATCAKIAAGFLTVFSSLAQTTTVQRATEIRADKLTSAPVLGTLAPGAGATLLGLEGGWAQVEIPGSTARGATVTGWVRASALALQAGSAEAASMANGRMAGNNVALSLGVRSLPPRENRHALIIGVSRYADASIPALPGAQVDRESATQMARAMQVPQGNIHYLQDEQATGEGIRGALKSLNSRVQDGDRVFVHYSGHGTRYNDPKMGGCVEALLAHDGGQSGTLTNREMADLLKPITYKTDKLFVMYDACHSGGLVQTASTVRTRGFSNSNDEGLLRPKFAAISEECGRPVNVRGRNLLLEQTEKGALPQDIIHVSASRDNEVSFDDEQKGGLATQFMRDCMLRDARDLDGSGAISVDEIRQCAQLKLNKRMENDARFKPHNIMLNGNTGFVPAWFSQALPGAQVLAAASNTASVLSTPPAPVPPSVTQTQTQAAAPAPAPAQTSSPPPRPAASAPAAMSAPAPTLAPAPVPAAAPAAALALPPAKPALTGEQAMRQMFEQRDAKRRVQVTLSRDKLKIGQDALDFAVQSDRAGYVYVAMAGSDNKSLYLLFPNDLDQNNAIAAGQQLLLPRPNWRVKAGGPPGVDSLLVIVADGPRDLAALAGAKAGPFVTSLNDAGGRAQLGAILGNSRWVNTATCGSAAARKNNPLCSDAYGAVMTAVEEVR